MKTLVSKAALAAAAAIVWIATPAHALDLVGLDGRKVTVTAQQYAGLPRVAVTVSQHGKMHKFEGPRLSDLLKLVHAPAGEALRGRDLTDVALVTAKDGYQIVLTLAETDPAMRKEIVLVADKMDGAPLPATDGPYRLIVQNDLRPARAARMIQRIELRRLATAKP